LNLRDLEAGQRPHGGIPRGAATGNDAA